MIHSRPVSVLASAALIVASLCPAVPAAAGVVVAGEAAAVRPVIVTGAASASVVRLSSVDFVPSRVPVSVSLGPVRPMTAKTVPVLSAIPSVVTAQPVPSAPNAVAALRFVPAAAFFETRPGDAPPSVARDSSRFDGLGRPAPAFSEFAAASEPVSAEASPAAPTPRSRLARFASAPWRKAKSGVDAIAENAAWTRSFWRSLRGDGVRVGRELRAASVMALILAAVSLAPSWLYGEMAQHLKDLQTLVPVAGVPWYRVPALQTFGALSAALVAVHAASAWLTMIQSRYMYDLGNKLMKGISDLYVAKVLSLDMRWQNSRSVGEVVSTATDAIYTLQSTASAMIVDLVRHGAVALISGAVMVGVSWQMSLFTIPFLAFVLSIPAGLYGKKVEAAYISFFASKKPRFAGALQEIAANILKVKAAGLEDRELAKMRERSHETYVVGGGEIAAVAAPQRALSGGLTDVARVLVIAAAVAAVYAGLLPVAAAVTYIFLSNFFRESMEKLTGLWVSLKSMRGAAAKYDRTMKLVSEDLRAGGKVLPPTAAGRRIELRGVKFRYTKDGAPVLRGIDLDIAPGEMVGFVGLSGGGKTTTALAVLGLYPLEAGEVRIDGVPLDELNLSAFRKEVGVALQDSIPVAGTVAENIAYLRPDATDAEIRAAARAAGLDEQIERFDGGYSARVGERGLNLSGGQKQRLMLSQIFIQPEKPFGVMIYDEPTSALDGNSQALIEDQIAERRGKTTQIVIAHRLSNVQRADRIVVFQDGVVVEQGAHADLMARGGVYAKMWDAQRLLDAAQAATSR